MKSQLIILILLIVSKALIASNHCACTELKYQNDCQNELCKWTVINSSCEAETLTPTCSNYVVQTYCDADQGCAWINPGACVTFTKCSDYSIASIADAAQCYLKDPTCVPGTASGTTVPCTIGTVKCSDVTDQTVCPQLKESSSSICTWSTKCISQDISKCSTITEETVCKNQGCAFAGSKCAAPTCAGQNQDACKVIRADTYGSVQICTYEQNACADAVDTTALTAANCYNSTSGFYRWDGSACVACSTIQCPNSVSGQVYNESLVIGNSSEPFIYYHQILILEQKMEKCEPTDKIINATLYLVQDNNKKQFQIKKANLDIPGNASFEIYIENFWRNFSFLIEVGTNKSNFTLKSTTFDCVALSKENFNCPTCQQQCEETGINEEGCGSCVPEEYSFTTHLFCMVYFSLLISL